MNNHSGHTQSNGSSLAGPLPVSTVFAHGLQRAARVMAGLVVVLGLAVLAGWAFSVPALKSVAPGWVTMKANTAIGFVLGGVALCLVQRPGVGDAARVRWRRQVSLSCAVVVALLGALTLAQEFFSWQLGIDEWLFREGGSAIRTGDPGRMSPVTALCFLFVGGALACIQSAACRLHRAGRMLAGTVGVLGLVSLAGYFYGAAGLHTLPGFTSMAVHTSMGFLLLSAGVLAAFPEAGFMQTLASDTLGGLLARRLLPASVLVPLLLGGLILSGERAGFYRMEMGLALFAVANVLVLGGLVGFSATRLGRLDARRLALIEALRISGRRYREFMDGLPVAAYTTDAHGRIDLFNNAAVALWGRRPASGDQWCASHKLFNRDGSPVTHDESPMAIALRENRPVRAFEAAAERPDSSRFSFLAYATPFRHESGQVAGAMNAMVDITDRKRAEEELRELNGELEARVARRTAELEEANKELDEFAHSVSHDLRAPLRAITGFGQFLSDECASGMDDRARGYLQRMMDASGRMNALIDDLLQFAHASRAELKRVPVNLSALAQEVACELQEAAPERVVRFDCTPDLIVAGDPRLLRVVLANLLGNAWKYTGNVAGPRVEFGVEPGTQGQAYFIRDNGAGFDMKYVHRLFGAFQRLHSAAQFEGTGVGLATVQCVIHRHGGKISAEGKVNEGAIFRFTLPSARESDAPGGKSR